MPLKNGNLQIFYSIRGFPNIVIPFPNIIIPNIVHPFNRKNEWNKPSDSENNTVQSTWCTK